MTDSLTPAASSVQRLLRAFADAGIDAGWAHTGGGCFAIQIDIEQPEYDYLLITDYEDVLSDGDYESDDDRYGWSLGRYVYHNREGYAFDEAEMVEGGRPTIYRTRNLDAIAALVEIVKVELATTITRNMCERCARVKGQPNRNADGVMILLCESCHAA